MTTPEDVIAATIKAGLSTYMPNHHLNGKSVIGQLAAAGYEVVPAGTAHRLAALLDAIEAHKIARRYSTTATQGEDIDLWNAAAAVSQDEGYKRVAAEARLVTLLDAIGDPDMLRSMAHMIYTPGARHELCRIADAAAAARENHDG
jgi:hypothetical protein